MPNTVTAPKLQEGRSAPRELYLLCNQLLQYANLRYTTSVKVTTTLTADATDLWDSTDMPLGSVWDVEVIVLGHATDDSSACYRRVGRFRRLTGTAALLGSVATPVTDYEDVAGWNVSLAASGNGVLLQVTGDAARTIDWSALVQVREIVAAT